MTEGIRGLEQLEALGKRFKAAGGTPLRKELLRGIRETSKPTIARIRETAAAELPASGGLAAKVAKSPISTRTRLTGKGAGVTIAGTGKTVRNLNALNDGRLRHPVFGNRSAWVNQAVRPNWFTRPVEEDAPAIRKSLEGVMDDVAQRIEKG